MTLPIAQNGTAETFGYDPAGNRSSAANNTVGWDRLNRRPARSTAAARPSPSPGTRPATFSAKPPTSDRPPATPTTPRTGW